MLDGGTRLFSLRRIYFPHSSTISYSTGLGARQLDELSRYLSGTPFPQEEKKGEEILGTCQLQLPGGPFEILVQRPCRETTPTSPFTISTRDKKAGNPQKRDKYSQGARWLKHDYLVAKPHWTKARQVASISQSAPRRIRVIKISQDSIKVGS